MGVQFYWLLSSSIVRTLKMQRVLSFCLSDGKVSISLDISESGLEPPGSFLASIRVMHFIFSDLLPSKKCIYC